MFKLSPIDACQLVVTLCVMIDLLGLSLTIPILANYARDVQGPAPGCPPTGLTNATEYDRMYHSDACQHTASPGSSSICSTPNWSTMSLTRARGSSPWMLSS